MLNNGNPKHYTDLHNADLVGRRTRDYIERFATEDRPFFVWASQTAPHSSPGGAGPIPAKRHRNLLEAPSLPPPAQRPSTPTARNCRLRCSGRNRCAPRSRRASAPVSPGASSRCGPSTSRWGRSSTPCGATGELDNTVFVFITDNGYLLGEHRHKGKNVAYDEAVRIPFLMRGPGIPRGSRSEVPAGLMDLAPTFVDLANADPDLTMDGVSLLPAARSGADMARDTVLVQGGADVDNDVTGWLWRGAAPTDTPTPTTR